MRGHPLKPQPCMVWTNSCATTNVAWECLLEVPAETRGNSSCWLPGRDKRDVFPQLLYIFDKFRWSFTNWFPLQRLQTVSTVTVTDDYWSLFATALHLEVSLPDHKYLSATHLTERLPILITMLGLEAFDATVVFNWIFCDLCAIMCACICLLAWTDHLP